MKIKNELYTKLENALKESLKRNNFESFSDYAVKYQSYFKEKLSATRLNFDLFYSIDKHSRNEIMNCLYNELNGNDDHLASALKENYRNKMKTLKQKFLDAGLQVDTRYSDLFVEANEVSRKIIREHRLDSVVHFRSKDFQCQITHKTWIELPFMHVEYFNKR